MNPLKQLGKDSVLYAFGEVIARGISFSLLPVYTRIFTPAEYGNVELISVLTSFVGTILSMGMDSAQSMYFVKAKSDGKSEQALIVSSILQWRLLWGSGVVLLSTLLAPLLNALFFNGRLSWEYFAVAFLGMLFVQIMSQSREVMRLLYRPWSFISVTIAQSLITSTSVLIAVLVFNLGIFGFFLGLASGSLAAGIYGWYCIRNFLAFDRLHNKLWPHLLRFGAPLVPGEIALYCMDSADRWFIQLYEGDEVLGIYSIGLKFALLMLLPVEAFRRSSWPIALDSMFGRGGHTIIKNIALLYTGGSTSLIIVLTLASPWLVKLFTAPPFHNSWPIVGIMAWQPLFYGFLLIASSGIWKSEKTYLRSYLIGITSILGLGFNWLMVPVYGIGEQRT